ncbi:hypothetical protein ACCO45_006484 [Purpureocillium lilacinum]|uniref:Uncharacterized protein n=1 Tax=Purpureocillium lilacinum TaxID=33203 RepID=A0ACC4DR28_PURLI
MRQFARAKMWLAAETLANGRTMAEIGEEEAAGYGGRWEYRERRPFREPQGQVHETDRVTGDTVLILDSQGNVVKWGSLNIDGGGGDQGNIQRAHPGMSATHSSHIVGPPGQILHNTGHERFLVIRVPDRRKWIGDDKKRVAVDDLEPPRQRKYIRTVNERLPTIEAGDASGSAEKGTGSAAQGGAMDVDIVDALSGSPKEVIGSEVDNVVTSIEGENTRERCGSCGQLTHKLDSCVRPGRDGTLHGCPMCNSSAHNVEQCVKWPRMTIGQKYRVLVHNRGRMVPLYTEQEELWYHIFIQRSESMGAEMGTPRYFPYTREFGKGYFGDEEELSSWEEFYDCFDHAILPVDNKTRDERMVRRLFAGAVYQSARDVRPRPRVQTVEDTSELLCDTEDEEERSLG